MAHILPDGLQQGWQCPVCKHVYAPSVAMCTRCPAQPAAGTPIRINYGYGNPCPRPKEGGLCGCDEDEPEGPQDCYGTRCSC